jgi:CRP/FNR family transcriptional regulator, anaerobic regulatory protein
MLAFSSEMREDANAAWRDGQHMSQTPIRSLAAGDVLYQKGDTRARLYRVVRGSLCHYMRSGDHDSYEIIEFAFPGDIVGFGNLEAHISTAQAMVGTEVSLVTSQDFAEALETDAQLSARVAAAIDREFYYLRNRAIHASKPAVRVASFLTALSRVNASEGRDPEHILDEIPSGVVAERLLMSIDCLAQALEELEHEGLITTSTAGLQIVDVRDLESFADAA